MNMYTTKDLREEINWMSHKAVVEFLDSKGIKPVLTRKVTRNTYRLYDETALIKCKELRLEREREQGLIKLSEPQAAPDLHTTLKRMHEELAAVRRQVDHLVKELSGEVAIFDDEGSGSAD